MPILMVADAGPHAGLGHLSRSTAVATALRGLGCAVECRSFGDGEARTVDGIAWRPLGEVVVADAIVADSYTLPEATLAEWARHAPLAVFSDGGLLPPGTRLATGVGPLTAPDGVTVLDGPRHACVREPFWEVPSREVAPQVERVLVSVGGGAHRQVLERLAAAVAAALPGARATLLAGPYADVPDGFDVLRAAPDLRDVLLQTDLAVCAGGQTTLEAAACGTPCAAFAMLDNQRGQVRALAAEGAVVELGADWQAAIAALADRARREELARRARRVVDGRGAHRVAAAISSL